MDFMNDTNEFLLEHGSIAAEKTLADRCLFVLNDEQWQEFQAILDRPVQEKPRLKKLLTSPGVFDRGGTGKMPIPQESSNYF
ncbi:MAG: DUF1778 domain-containing protein [Cyanosarcina radialis HA8281-LM2]|jgi:uncharacterized protein (DUF1778 family)|nr:DUF1778 domain-containing protein [Cyanosarcina radialis HA8281-LM2]